MSVGPSLNFCSSAIAAVLLVSLFTSPVLAELSEERAEVIIRDVLSLYEDEIEAVHHLPIHLRFYWKSDSIQALGGRVDDESQVQLMFFGGLLRGEMDEDTLLAVICHELGHILGGWPERYPYPTTMNSVEGQADYFASAKCLRRVYSEKDNRKWLLGSDVPSTISSTCLAAYPNNERDSTVCMRSLDAVLKFFRLMKDDPNLSYEHPDPRVVESTLMTYPSVQCRLDTHLAGAICPIGTAASFSFDDPNAGACVRGRSSREDRGARPRCWYHPASPRFQLE